MPKLAHNLTEAQLDGRACIRCGAENQHMHPVEAWSERSAQLFECVDTEACSVRAGDICDEFGTTDVRDLDPSTC
jgi:hypothetical protein